MWPNCQEALALVNDKCHSPPLTGVKHELSSLKKTREFRKLNRGMYARKATGKKSRRSAVADKLTYYKGKNDIKVEQRRHMVLSL